MSEEKKPKKEAQGQLVEMETSVASEMIISVKGEGGGIFRFTMPFNTPLPECYNASLNVAHALAGMFNEAIKKQKAKEAEEKKEGKKDN